MTIETYTPHDYMISEFIDCLPHGSGFDCDWKHVKTQKNGVEVFTTYFHNMNDGGYYDGYTQIKIKVDMKNPGDFKFICASDKYSALNSDYWEESINFRISDKY